MVRIAGSIENKLLITVFGRSRRLRAPQTSSITHGPAPPASKTSLVDTPRAAAATHALRHLDAPILQEVPEALLVLLFEQRARGLVRRLQVVTRLRFLPHKRRRPTAAQLHRTNITGSKATQWMERAEE